MPRRRLRKIVIRSAAALLLAVGGFVAWRYATGNTGTIAAGEFHRSGQLGPGHLGRLIRSRGIRTVLNLRGPNPDQAWYRAERSATLAAGATQVDVPLSSDYWLSREQARSLLNVLETCERPVLVHCEWGAERTGLVSAFVELLRPGGTVGSARRQFSPWYLFVPLKDGRIMRGHIDAYAAWLAGQHAGHSPDRFRVWMREGYRPKWPSREQWPYDPYPLVVVTRPPAPTPVARKAAGPAPVR